MRRRLSGEEVTVLPSGSAPQRRRLEGSRILLEPLDPELHSEPLYAASHENEEARRVWTYLPDGPFGDFASFRQWAARMASEPDRRFFAFRDKQSARLGGMATYLEIRPAMGSIEVGYIWFAPFLQRTAHSTEALFLMLRYAFDELRYRRIQWRCNALNENSRAAASRLGFTFEGILRGNFERWLAPSNFDAQGRQLSSLRGQNDPRAG